MINGATLTPARASYLEGPGRDQPRGLLRRPRRIRRPLVRPRRDDPRPRGSRPAWPTRAATRRRPPASPASACAASSRHAASSCLSRTRRPAPRRRLRESSSQSVDSTSCSPPRRASVPHTLSPNHDGTGNPRGTPCRSRRSADSARTRSRVRTDWQGGAVRERASGIAAALYTHRLSRNLDPQLHTHCAIANLAQTERR